MLAVIVVGTSVCVATAPRIATAYRTVHRPESHTSQWESLHGREAVHELAACRVCHDAVFCRACHLAAWPHASGWQRIHGGQAKRTNSRGCGLCHRDGFCRPCHGGLDMPHPETFIASHTRIRGEPNTCETCHVDRDCDTCHAQHDSHTAGGLMPE